MCFSSGSDSRDRIRRVDLGREYEHVTYCERQSRWSNLYHIKKKKISCGTISNFHHCNHGNLILAYIRLLWGILREVAQKISFKYVRMFYLLMGCRILFNYVWIIRLLFRHVEYRSSMSECLISLWDVEYCSIMCELFVSSFGMSNIVQVCVNFLSDLSDILERYLTSRKTRRIIHTYLNDIRHPIRRSNIRTYLNNIRHAEGRNEHHYSEKFCENGIEITRAIHMCSPVISTNWALQHTETAVCCKFIFMYL